MKLNQQLLDDIEKMTDKDLTKYNRKARRKLAAVGNLVLKPRGKNRTSEREIIT